MERWRVVSQVFLINFFLWFSSPNVGFGATQSSYLPSNDLLPGSGQGDGGAVTDNAQGIRLLLVLSTQVRL